jgi:hypothetical protein
VTICSNGLGRGLSEYVCRTYVKFRFLGYRKNSKGLQRTCWLRNDAFKLILLSARSIEGSAIILLPIASMRLKGAAVRGEGFPIWCRTDQDPCNRQGPSPAAPKRQPVRSWGGAPAFGAECGSPPKFGAHFPASPALVKAYHPPKPASPQP